MICTNISKSFFRAYFAHSFFYILYIFLSIVSLYSLLDAMLWLQRWWQWHKKRLFIYTEAEKRPLKKIVARAGTNLTLPCNALNEKSISKIEKLTWKLSQTIIVKFIDGKSLDHQNKRVSWWRIYSKYHLE